MEAEHASRWQRIQQHPLDKPGVALPFSVRLAREHGWTHAFTQRAIEEYRRFVLLAVSAVEPVTPSDEVDRVWHLHLTYTHDYWGPFTHDVLERPLHHVPTEGGPAERVKHAESYARTLARYREVFAEEPPPALWPPASIRFAATRRARRSSSLLARSTRSHGLRVLAGSCVLGLLLVGCERLGGQAFLGLFLAFAVVVFASAAWLQRRLLDLWAPRDAPSLDVFGVAYLAGGAGRVFQLALARLLREHAVRVATGVVRPTQAFSGPATAHDGLGPEARDYELALARELTRAGPEGLQSWRLQRRLAPELAHIRDRVRATGLLPPWLARHAARLLTLSVPVVGVLRAFDGTARGKPVGFLWLLSIVASILIVKGIPTTERLGRVGRRWLEDYRQQSWGPRPLRDGEPPRDGLFRSLAVIGAAAVFQTQYASVAEADLGTLSEAGGDGGSDGSSDGGGGDGGGGDGGCGGCGGCS